MRNNVRLREAVTSKLAADEINGERLTLERLEEALEMLGAGNTMWMVTDSAFIACIFCGQFVDQTSICETAKHAEHEVLEIQKLVGNRREWRKKCLTNKK